MSRDVHCRRAGLGDLDSILCMESQGFREDSFSRRQLRYLIQRATGAFFAAVRQGIVVGYICVLTRKNTNGRIYSLVVDPEYRGRGVAGLLLETGLEYLRQKRITSVFLEVAVDNAAAIALYEKKGFVRRKVFRRYYHAGGDAFSMVLFRAFHA
jgi:ribosomal-protein-alanine acetyltransferase